MAPLIRYHASRPYSALAARYDATLGIPNFLGTRRAFEVLVNRYGIDFRSAADIGCGTGLFARYLCNCWGIPTFAVDRSPEMLRIAMRNCDDCRICFLLQDIRCLALPHPVDLMTANFDTMNHLLTRLDLQLTLRRIYQNLRPGGYFIFDLITPCRRWRDRLVRIGYRPGTALGIRQWIRWDAARRLLFTTVSFRRPGSLALASEYHVERAFSPLHVARWLEAAGFVIRDILDSGTLRVATGCPPRIIFVAHKQGGSGGTGST